MFVNNNTGERGLVCQYDVVCFDEVAGISFDRKDGVTIMKGYEQNLYARDALLKAMVE
jgi:ATP-dependent Lon protease